MYVTYWDRINASVLRFTDPRLLEWKTPQAARYDYIPVMGAGESIYIKRTPVTNAEYAAYLDATGAQAPSNWTAVSYTHLDVYKRQSYLFSLTDTKAPIFATG